MKKFLFFFVALASMLATSCSDEEFASGINESAVTFTVTTPQLNSRATSTYGNGAAVNNLQYAVYLKGTQTPLITTVQGSETAFDGDATSQQVAITLANGKSYDIIFWADNSTAPYEVNWDTQTMTINPANLASQNESLDAFYKKITIDNVQGPINQEVELERPFSQLNIATKDIDDAEAAGVEVAKTSVVVKAYTTLNLGNGSVDNNTELTYSMAAIPTTGTTITVSGVDYNLLSMNYLLVNAKELVDVKFNYFDSSDQKIDDATYEAVPVQRNYKTNIIGDLLTSAGNFNVTLLPGFTTPDYDYDGPVTVANVAEANTAFANGATSVTITDIPTTGSSTSINLPDVTGATTAEDKNVELFLPATTEPLVINEPTGTGSGTVKAPEVLNLTVPNGDISNITFNTPNTTVYVNGVLTNVTASTANNTLYVTAGTTIENLTIGKGNVVIEKGASVNTIARSTNNTDQKTVVYYYKGETIPTTSAKEIEFEVIVAEVDGKYYSNLTDAVAAADGKTIKMLDNLDVDADNTITIPEGQTMTLDLNEFTVSGVSDDADKNDDGKLTSADNEVMIDVRGSLTVKNGTMTIKHTSDNFAWNACTEVFYVGFNGSLTVENATIENLGGSDMAYCIDLVNADAKTNGITVNINNSTIKSTYIPVRVFNNGAGMNNVTINNTTLNGTSRALWVHIYSDKDNGGKGIKDSTLNLDFFNNGNTFIATNPDRIIEYGFDDEINFDAQGNLIARNEAALDYALANDATSVTLGYNITVSKTITIAKDKTFAINMHGFNLNSTVSNDGKAAAIISNYGTLNIQSDKENSEISFKAENPDLQDIPKYATNTISNFGTLTIGKNVTVINTSDGGASYAVDNHAFFTLDGGTLQGYRCALRVAKYNPAEVEFTMNSGIVTAFTPAWIQLPGSDAKTAPKITVNIKGGTMQSTKETSSADNNVMYTYSYGNSHENTVINISGGNFLGGTVSIGSGYKGDVPALNITGGTFEYDVLQWLENDESKVIYEANK